jgi:hypothetical protein
MTMLAELGAAELAAAVPAGADSGKRFADVLGRVLGRRPERTDNDSIRTDDRV